MVIGFDGYVSDDRWARYQPSTYSKKKNFEAFKRALRARKARHNQQLQKDDANRQVVVYWENFLHNAKKVDDLERIQRWVEDIEETIRKSHEVIGNQKGGSRPNPTPNEVVDSNNNGTKVQLSVEPILGFNFDDDGDDVQKKGNDDGFSLFIGKDESSGSHHSTSKPKPKKKKKPPMTKK